MNNQRIVRISSSLVNLFLECQRCFWLQINQGIKRPETPSSSLPNGVDLSLKAYFDFWRKDDFGLPPLLKNKLPGRLLKDESVIAFFRSRSFEWYDKENEVFLLGILDDALELPDGSIVPLDNKTRGFPPLETHNAHFIQMSVYSLLLKEKGFKTKNIAYLVYWFLDHKNLDLNKPLEFNIAVEEVKTDPDLIKNLLKEIVRVLKGPIPPSSSECHFCHYLHEAKNY